MKPNEIIRDVMKLRGFSNQSLATKLGKSTASAVSTKLSREKGMRIDTFLKMIEAMDCELVVKSKLADKTTWKVNDEPRIDLGALLSDDEEPSPQKSTRRIKLK